MTEVSQAVNEVLAAENEVLRAENEKLLAAVEDARQNWRLMRDMDGRLRSMEQAVRSLLAEVQYGNNSRAYQDRDMQRLEKVQAMKYSQNTNSTSTSF